jgi:hypothetical protein
MFFSLLTSALLSLFPAVHVCAAPCKVTLRATDAAVIVIDGPTYSTHDCTAEGHHCAFPFTFGEGEWFVAAVGADGKLSPVWSLIVN